MIFLFYLFFVFLYLIYSFLTNKYIYLQKLRFEDRFIFSEEIDTNIVHFKIPILSIQLLIENSFQHANKNYQSVHEDYIVLTNVHLRIEVIDNFLNITVCDNGKIKNYSPSKGSGMWMLIERLNTVYQETSFSHGYLDKTILAYINNC